MRLSLLAPIGAVSAAAAGLALLGSSLGGIASVDQELAAGGPAAAPALDGQEVVRPQPAAFEDSPQPSSARFAGEPVRAPRLRIVRLTDDQGARSIMVVVDPGGPDGCGGRQSDDQRPDV